MNTEIEALIVKSFFVKRVQDRVLYELSNPQKRKDALHRLSSYEKFLERRIMKEIPKPNSNYLNIETLLKQQGASDECYAISWCEDIDGKQIPLKTALKRAVGLGMPSLVFCFPHKLGYFEGEQEYGPPERYILLKNN
ncbi:hypothetical protein [Cohnella candidum]|uniref:Uncharacterized protein n=1 Tax=Cohnella candidum TaxID=2674991 RepID=A0A3G3JVZ5_9BACL|nr:hypothetical protein [Cohnella candidum]AYQ72420.1 hypothetical protein EAV92_07455 [Cohnella candidum]